MMDGDSTFYKQNTLPDFYADGTSLPPLPEKIGLYRIDSLLNRGSMALLYLGLHPETRQPLAIKVLSPQFVNHPETKERFFKEAQIIALTSHPNIVKLYGQGEWEGGLYIAMELIQGVSLRQFIMQQSLSLKRSIDIVLQVAYALLHLHTHGVIHRDLKPENILIAEDGTIKVIDFGIAQVYDESSKSRTTQMVGTPNYMSPEQKEKSSKISYSTDIYSLGIIAYELIIGKLSYGIVNLSLLPKGLRTIIEKSLAVSVQERYQDIVDFISDLSQYLKSGEVEKDRTGSDQMKELLEMLIKTAHSLSPPSPRWSAIDIGIAKHTGQGQLGLYYDFFKLPNQTYLSFLAQTNEIGYSSSVYAALVKGMVHTLIYEKSRLTKAPFELTSFVSTLHHLLQNAQAQPMKAGCLLLNPQENSLSFISCGLSSLYHLSSGRSHVQIHQTTQAPLGMSSQEEFSIVTDNWMIGDALILPSFGEEIEKDIFAHTSFLSAQSQAESILKKVLSLPTPKTAKTLITLQRVS